MLTTLANRAKMALWAAKVERIVKNPPGSDDDFSPEAIERESKVTFSSFSTWSIICQEVLDTQFARVYFERAREELRRRGISDAEIADMRRFAWLTAGWLNFEQCLWDWCSLDERDIYRAIEWQYSAGYISADERDRRSEYANRYNKPRRIKLMWDYHCWPLWHYDDGQVGCIDPETLPLSPDAKTRLEAWASIPDAKLAEHISAPQDMTWTDAELRAFESEGLELWRILRRELGSDFYVVYHNPLAGPLRRPDDDSQG